MGELTLLNLPEGGSVTIYNGNGLEVYSTEVGAETSMTWDGKNSQGSPVMSGVYYVVTKDSQDKVTDKRPIMIVN
jgi:flagellar hook assembly protein FlgD